MTRHREDSFFRVLAQPSFWFTSTPNKIASLLQHFTLKLMVFLCGGQMNLDSVTVRFQIYFLSPLALLKGQCDTVKYTLGLRQVS